MCSALGELAKACCVHQVYVVEEGGIVNKDENKGEEGVEECTGVEPKRSLERCGTQKGSQECS